MTPESIKQLILLDAHLVFGEEASSEAWEEFAKNVSVKIAGGVSDEVS
jgi:hypothetical protein